MAYRSRLKIAAMSDALFIMALIAAYFLIKADGMKSVPITLIIILTAGTVSIAVQLYKERGEYRKRRSIWKTPSWQLAVYIVLTILLIVSIWVLSEGNSGLLIGIIIMTNSLVTDIRYYMNAVKYDMENIGDVAELVSNYPEAKSNINRKKLSAEDEEGADQND